MNTSAVQNQKPPNPPPAKAPAKPPRMAMTNVRKGVIEIPDRILIYGNEKVGKSTFAAGAPNPIFIGKDSGTEHLDIARLPVPRTWNELLEGLSVVLNEAHDFKTLVVDPVNWLEPMLHDQIVGDSGKSIEAWDGGFGRGYDAAVTHWRQMITLLERIWKKRAMNIVLVAHAQVKKFNDPEGAGYERYELEMANKRAAAALKQWVDSILFCRREAYGKLDATSKRVKAAGSAARVIHTEWQPAFDAGNRWCLPEELPLSWADYAAAKAAGPARRTKLLAEIETMLAELGDAEVETKVRGYLATPEISVVEVHNSLAAKVGERRELAAASTEPAAETPNNDSQKDDEG